MNRKQLASIECLTTQMLNAAPYSAKSSMVFTVKNEGDRGGYVVCGQTLEEHAHWTDNAFLILAFVGPRGGIHHRKEFR